MMKRTVSLLMALLLLIALAAPAAAVTEDRLRALTEETAAYTLQSSLEYGSEWVVIALARSGYDVPREVFDRYYESVKAAVVEREGVFRKFTEYAKLSIALTAIGRDPGDVGGYDLLEPLTNYDNMLSVGINGVSWALLGLDCGAYRTNDAAYTAVRQRYVELLLSRQLADGGFSLVGKGGGSMPADTDITAMTLQALAGYLGQPDVDEAVDRAVARLSEMQQADGSYQSMGISNSESAAQVLIALDALGISAEDERFVKNGVSALDSVLSYKQADGSYLHLMDGSGVGSIATEQAFCALTATLRRMRGQTSLYRMTDVEKVSGDTAAAPGLPGKHADVQTVPVTKAGTTFPDVRGQACQTAVEALAAREIINGMSASAFEPGANMTRAQYATIIVKALGLKPDAAGAAGFTDVPSDSWYAPYVGTACAYGIVNGRGEGIFDPGGTINRQEASAMTARAAALCGWDTSLDDAGVRMYIAEFTDYVTVDKWARPAMAFCFKSGILVSDEFEENLEPKQAILRSEVALMVYRLLQRSSLL